MIDPVTEVPDFPAVSPIVPPETDVIVAANPVLSPPVYVIVSPNIGRLPTAPELKVVALGTSSPWTNVSEKVVAAPAVVWV